MVQKGKRLLETLKNQMVQKDDQDKDYLCLKNGSILFKALIASTDGKYKNPIRIFSSRELIEATNNYDLNRIILQDGLYELYKGNLDNRNITVKNFIDRRRDASSRWINDAVIASQMIKHKNVVKILGCCLETSIPILVYESMPNGSLEDHLCGDRPIRLQHSFETRLKIAGEIANAVTYLHTAFERPIICRDLKIKNVLLDQHCIAKLQDFTLSVSIPKNETRVQDKPTGTFGYLAPECMSGSFTEKVDVYSFGIFLSVLFTGQRIFDTSDNCCDGDVFLINRVKDSLENNCFLEMVDPLLRNAGMDELKIRQLRMAFELAVRCTKEEEELRPTMMDAAKELKADTKNGVILVEYNEIRRLV